ncbi:MAG TPA: UDP-N-acetylglucosamine 2-epimerase (hydrolyzing) [Chitinophagaceae bacterium]|nr:UDP-N-acetylglucosamine 2-epimerase (hydrolyzing) [Chitinophagaceae bacterium]
MGNVSLKHIGLLTSSRADFGIYLPLIRALYKTDWCNLEIIAFGTHLSKLHGYTLKEIQQQDITVSHTIDTMPAGDSAEAIAGAMGLTQIRFSAFWASQQKHYDLVFCLGDRYEMFAAVMAGVPFGIKFAHLHGGETTLGAIDNVFRHAISHASWCHFTATAAYAERLNIMLDVKQRIYNTGSISLENLINSPLLTTAAFQEKFGIDITKPTILATLHPETVNLTVNTKMATEFAQVVKNFAAKGYQWLITLPNADTQGNAIREVFNATLEGVTHVYLRENLGVNGYFSALKHCNLLVGNSSSGIIEAASFGKFVINLGNRQQGRLTSDNVIHIEHPNVENLNIIIDQYVNTTYVGTNIYAEGGGTKKIIDIISDLLHG